MAIDIRMADETGFCFGVKRALKLLEAAIKTHGKVETIGPLVHNQQVVEKLDRLGARAVQDASQIKGNVAVIPSHGVPLPILEELSGRSITVIDTTCPNVRKAQNAAKELSKAGFWVVVYGDPSHPEVKGIIGWAGNKGMATLDVQKLTGQNLPTRLGLLSQTTRNRSQFVDFVTSAVSLLLPQVEELRVINTLCDVTKRRQAAALALAHSVDTMIVVGGRNSANTRCLAEVCSTAGATTHHVETASEIERSWFSHNQTIGVTTGTSISDNVIEEVVLKLEGIKRLINGQ